LPDISTSKVAASLSVLGVSPTSLSARELQHKCKARVERQEVDSINRASDLIIIPCPPDTLAAHAALQMTAALASMESSKYRVLITMVSHESYREQCEAMLKEKGVPYFRACIRRLVAFQKAAAGGQLVQEVDDDRAGAAWEGYQELGKEIDRLYSPYFRHDGRAKGRKEAKA
jgi:cellulose biosynthesis protein BcsQ